MRYLNSKQLQITNNEKNWFVKYVLDKVDWDPFILSVMFYSKDCHEGQFRKYGDEPYINHPIRVALRVSKFGKIQKWNWYNEMICAALLHDVVEDTEKTFDDVNSSLIVMKKKYKSNLDITKIMQFLREIN